MVETDASGVRAAKQMTDRRRDDGQPIEIKSPHAIIDPDKFVMSYDGDIDALMLYLFGRGRPAISVVLADSSYALVDPDTHALVGFQIEDFATEFVRTHPEFIDLLEFAELRDMSVDEVRALRQDVLGYSGRFKSWLRRVMWRVTKQSRKMAITQQLISSENKRIPRVAMV